MVKVFQGELPRIINVVVDGKILGVARFNSEGVYETDNKEILKELKRYGYNVETVKKTVKTEKTEIEEKEDIKPKPKTKTKTVKKKVK